MEARYKILVVDDDQTTLKLIEKSLQKEGYELVLFDNELEVIDKLKEWTPDLAILDIEMPLTNGLDLCKEIHTVKGLENLPVIFLSGRTGTNNRIMGYKAGAIHYIEKPFELEELKVLVSSVLHFRGIASSIAQDEEYTFNEDTHLLTINGFEISLSPTESLLVKKLLGRKGQLIEREILVECLPEHEHHKSRSLDTHISSLRKKFKNSGFSLKTIYGKGFVLELEEVQEVA